MASQDSPSNEALAKAVETVAASFEELSTHITTMTAAHPSVGTLSMSVQMSAIRYEGEKRSGQHEGCECCCQRP